MMPPDPQPDLAVELEEARLKIIQLGEITKERNDRLHEAYARITELEAEVDEQADQYIAAKADANKLRLEVRQLKKKLGELPKGKT